jgi:uncharacterized protein YndB with AHSA1/START domain
MTASTEVASRGFTIVRMLDAPRELVFEAWTDPKHLHWFADVAPDESRPSTVDLRVGGAWRVHLVQPDGPQYVTGGIYSEIVAPEKLVFSWGATGGWPDLDMVDDAPIATVVLKDIDGATEMTFTLGFAKGTSEARVQEWLAMGVRPGWANTLERLVDYLPTTVASRPTDRSTG